MRLVSYGSFGAERAGFQVEDALFDLEKAMRAAAAETPVADMRLFLEQPAWRSLLDLAFAARDRIAPIAAESVRLGAPVPVPRTLIIAGANTKSHIAEAGGVLAEQVPVDLGHFAHEHAPHPLRQGKVELSGARKVLSGLLDAGAHEGIGELAPRYAKPQFVERFGRARSEVGYEGGEH